MITYLFLITIILLLLRSAYRRFDRDLLSPTVISCSVFGFSVFLAIIGLLSWNDQKNLNSFSIIIYITGLAAFYLGEILARKIYFKKHPKDRKNKRYKIQNISVNRYLYIGATVFIVLTAILLVLEIKRVCAEYGFEADSIPELLASYRSKTPLFSQAMLQDDAPDIGFIVKQMKKIVDILSLIFTYIAINNFFYEKGRKAKILALIRYGMPVVLCCLVSLLTSGRSQLMHIAVTAAMAALLYAYQTNKLNIKTLNRKIITVLAITVTTLLVGFYAILPLIGRSAGNSNIVDYISFYLGTPLPSLNSKTANFKKNDDSLFGEKTFANVYYTLNRYNIIQYTKPSANDWTKHGNFKSNVYSAFFPIYYDFGIVGIMALQLCSGLCISYIYLKVRYQKKRLLFLIYCFYAYVLIDQIRGEAFYSLVSSSTIVYLILITLFYVIYIRHVSRGDIEAFQKDLSNIKQHCAERLEHRAQQKHN